MRCGTWSLLHHSQSEKKEPNQIELIRSTMSEQLLPIIQQINPTRLLEMGANTGRMEGKIEMLQEQIDKIGKRERKTYKKA